MFLALLNCLDLPDPVERWKQLSRQQSTAELVSTMGRVQGKAEQAGSVPFSRAGKRETSLSCWGDAAAGVTSALGVS